MKTMYAKQASLALVAALNLVSMLGTAQAAVSADEAKRLGTTLNPQGGEMAGNKDGTIPAWDASKLLNKPPPSWKPRADPRYGAPYMAPFPEDKPLFSINKENMGKYLDKLDAGSIELLKTREGYRMDVYPSRRTFGVPDWVAENTKKCATSAKLIADGLAFEGAQACIPFPIPKNGYEVMWNMITYMREPSFAQVTEAYVVGASGKASLVSRQRVEYDMPYWNKQLKAGESPWLYRVRTEVQGPANKVGERSMQLVPFRIDQEDTSVYSYTPGLRRVRLVPDGKYDTIVSTYGGMFNYDELSTFSGRLDRFDFKLAGKKEMYVPYNNIGFASTPLEEVLKSPGVYPNPNVQRFELHRVWLVEATLKAGMRHAQSKKVFYIDEDSWGSVIYNAFDKEGKIVKANYAGVNLDGGFTATVGLLPTVFFDLTRGTYALSGMVTNGAVGYFRTAPLPPTTFTPESFANTGIR
jgi:hypothetical protein